MTPRYLGLTLASVVGGLCWLTLPPASLAADPFTAVTSAEKSAKSKKPKAQKPPVNSSTGETPSERNQRLLRECRGKANAGACEGFAS